MIEYVCRSVNEILFEYLRIGVKMVVESFWLPFQVLMKKILMIIQILIDEEWRVSVKELSCLLLSFE